MKWSPQQAAALDAVGRWLRTQNQPVFRIFGYAGVGKSELSRYIAQQTSGTVLYAAYTGKAASVMRRKGCTGAQTIHSLIYKPKEKSRQKLLDLQQELHDLPADAPPQIRQDLEWAVRIERQNVGRPSFSLNVDSDLRMASLLICDEVSMIPEDMALDLLSFRVPILVLGDPAQLPPVRGTGFFMNGSPDVMLTEIHRQAADNPIIRLSMMVREGQQLTAGDYGESRIIDRIELRNGPDMALAHDQILCGLNRTRRSTNARVRQLRGISEMYSKPEIGDKLVCLRNSQDVPDLLNGSLWNVVDVDYAEDADSSIGFRLTPVETGCNVEIEVQGHPAYFNLTKPEDELSPWDLRTAEAFDYGYALTCHKFQGSQAPSVLVIDEAAAFRSPDIARRWRYTAITRAEERVTYVL